MSIRLAFIGFRHGHILSLYKLAHASDEIEVVAVGEDHAPTRDKLASDQTVTFTHDDSSRLLDEVDCDVIAIGDTYARRGNLAIAALERGRHVILDKPICTDLDELARIEQLARDHRLAVGCQLELRDAAVTRTARRLIREGSIGDVWTVTFTGQHPLMYGSRPAWYFEPGQHGGTINDIAIHAFDALEWMTGQPIAEVVAARAWNVTTRTPHFQDGGQMMLRFAHGGGVLGDVSYLAPEKCGYQVPQYWRFTIHGSGGMLEISLGERSAVLATHDDDAPVPIELDPNRPGGYLADFLRDLRGQDPEEGGITTAQLLTASRWSLQAQAMADATFPASAATGG